ncbi:MAG: dienelactone hydrolase family protein [Acidobacteria bacterium]|nr:dienelactone hydrolase family protein [Acidobacteriota bacterium]
MMKRYFRIAPLAFVSFALLLVIFIIGSGIDMFAQRRIGKGGILGRKGRTAATTNSALHSININGTSRTYLLHEPRRASAIRKKPLVIMLHGGGGNGSIVEPQTGLSKKADKEGFIVVYPYGSGKTDNILLTWNAVGCCAYAMKENTDDVAFISRLIDKLIKDNNVDKDRIYVIGHSNGAMMTLRLGRELGDKLTAIASVAGAMFDTDTSPRSKIPVLFIHGEADGNVKIEGGMSGQERVVPAQSKPFLPLNVSINYWTKHNGCDPVPLSSRKGKVTHKVFRGCESGNGVEIFTIRDAGHSWPGGESVRGNGDEPAKDLSATDTAWDFFEKHR